MIKLITVGINKTKKSCTAPAGSVKPPITTKFTTSEISASGIETTSACSDPRKELETCKDILQLPTSLTGNDCDEA